MRDKRIVPGFGRIVSTDYVALLALLAPIVILGVYVALVAFGKIPDPRLLRHGGRVEWVGAENAHLFLYVSVGLAVVGIPAFIWRYCSIRNIFMIGQETTGTVVLKTEFKDRGRIEAEFTHAGQTIRIGNPVHLTRKVRAIQEGQKVTIVYMPRDPKKAFIKDIFV